MKKLAVPLAIGLSVGMSGAPVFAKSTIGGILFVNTYIDSSENDITGDDTRKLTLTNASNSRLRIRWTNEDKVSMYYEFAIGGNNKVRHAYGKWDFSETGQLLAGATSTPFAPLNPSVAMVHNSGQGYGSISPSRPSQIRYTYKFLNRHGAWAIALVDPNQGAIPGPMGTERESTVPRVDFGLAYRTFNWQIFPGAFYQKLDFSNNVDDLTAYGLSLGVRTGKGPFTLSAEFGTGQNWGNTKMSVSGSVAGDRATALYTAGNKDDDNDNTGYWIDAGYRFTAGETKGAAHLIYGYMSSQSKGGGAEVDAESTMIGLSVPVDLPYIARGLRFRPELFLFEDKDSGTAKFDTSNTIAGVQIQYTF